MDDNKKVALNTILKQIEKQFGKGAVMRLGDITALEVETVSTGSLGLDIALGVGGLPKGRVVEIYGPEASGKTTLTLQVSAEIQKQGGLVAFVDAEHALDSRYAEKLGVNVSELYLAQPNNGEEALEITDTLVRSGAFDLVVIDSVAALTPKAEIEGDMGDSHMGLHARLMSQALRKLTANISRTNTLVIFINQIRMKIGVMFGCFDYETPVVLANGSRKPIGKIVTQKMPLDVLSYNRSTDTFEPRRIVNWYNNGETNTFLQFKVVAQGRSNHYQFACTANHQLLTPTGYQSAGNMKIGDKLMTTVPFEIAPVREQIIWGLLLGDNGCDVINRHYRYNESLTEYQLWKQSLLAQPNSDEPDMCYLGRQECVAVLDSVLEKVDNDSNQNEYYPLIERLEPLAIAIWYMEHGYFDNKQGCCFIFNKPNLAAKQQALVEWFKRHHIYPRFKGSYLWFNQTETAKLHEMIAPYLHPSRVNKLSSNYRGRFMPLSTQPRRVWRAIPSSIIDIRKKPALQPRHRFDLEIEDNHNYVVDGVIVHNSPETTTGGNALKFYASVRLEIRRIGGVKRGEEIIGNETRVKIAKNKVAPPFKEAIFDILYGEGVSHESELLELGNQCNVIDKSGAWYSYKGSNLGQGKDNARLYLKEHPDIAKTIEEQIRNKLLPAKTTVSTPEEEKKSSEKNSK